MLSRHCVVLSLVVAAFMGLMGGPAQAGHEFPICTADWAQYWPAVSGNIVVWQDERNYSTTSMDIYAYDVRTEEEFAVCARPGYQRSPDISGDTVVWAETQDANGSGPYDIRGRNLVTGQGFPVCTAPGDQLGPKISGDVIVWMDGRNRSTNGYDIYGKRISTDEEFAICMAPGDQYSPAVSGNIVVWMDSRNDDGYGHNYDIYGCNLVTGQGFAVCTVPGSQQNPAVSGNIVVWEDTRNSTANGTREYDIYGKDLSTGVEFAVCTAPGPQFYPKVSGNIVVWDDFRNRPPPGGVDDIYGYDLSTRQEFAVCTAPSGQGQPVISGGLVVWGDTRNGDWDIYGCVLDIAPPALPGTLLRGNLHSHSTFSGEKEVQIVDLFSRRGRWFQKVARTEPPTPEKIFNEYAPGVFLGVGDGPQVWAVTDHYPAIHTTEWDALGQAALSATDVVGLRGFEWSDSTYSGPHINVIGSSEYPWSTDGSRIQTADELFAWLAGTDAIGQFNHPSNPKYGWTVTPPGDAGIDQRLALFEVGSGFYQIEKYGIDRLPVGRELQRHLSLLYTDSLARYIEALLAGWHVGATNSQDNHPYIRIGGEWKGPSNNTGIWVKDPTREGVMEALRNRWVFASEDWGFRLSIIANDSYFMGTRSVPAASDGRLHLRVTASDDDEPIGWLTVLGGPSGGSGASVFWDEHVASSSYDFPLDLEFRPNHWYFVIIEQDDGDTIVSSPVWTQ